LPILRDARRVSADVTDTSLFIVIISSRNPEQMIEILDNMMLRHISCLLGLALILASFNVNHGQNGTLDTGEFHSSFIDLLAYSLGVYYCQQLTVSVCLSLCLSRSFKLLLLFCFLMKSSHFWLCHLSMCPSTKPCSSIFDLGPLTPKIYSPKFAQNRR